MRGYKTVAYIVDNAVLQSTPPLEAYEAHPIPADPTKSLVYVHWDNPNWEAEFEATLGVMWLGFPWEPPPAEAVPLLQSVYADQPLGTSGANTIAIPVDGTPAPPESLASMLRKVSPTGRRVA